VDDEFVDCIVPRNCGCRSYSGDRQTAERTFGGVPLNQNRSVAGPEYHPDAACVDGDGNGSVASGFDMEPGT
jgi:hypothetical protein